MIRQHLTLPNQITLLRLLLVPVIGVTLGVNFPGHYQVSTGAYAVATISDTLDGELARRRHQVSELGKFLDPLVDKVLVVTVLLILVSQSILPAWIAVVIVARESLITGLRFVAASQGVVISATAWGKSKTLTQNIMIGCLMLAQPYHWFGPVAFVFVVLAVIATVASGLDYLWRYRRFVV